MIIFYFFVILSLFSSRGQPVLSKGRYFYKLFHNEKKELQKYVMLDRQKIAEKRDKKESDGFFSIS